MPWRNRSLLHKVVARAIQPLVGPKGLQPRMLAQSDDETCEILYLLLRAERPQTVVEISPFHGWSTCWLLSVLGDVRRHTDQLPPSIDFLWLDSDHSAEFAEWYLRTVVPRVKAGATIAVDDLFHHADPGAFDGEGRVVVDWLQRQAIPFTTCAKAKNPSALNAIHGFKVGAGLANRIHSSVANPALFFRAPAATAAAIS